MRVVRIVSLAALLAGAFFVPTAGAQTRADTLHLRDAVARWVQIRGVVNNSAGAKDMANRGIAAESLYFRSKAVITPPIPPTLPPAPNAALGVSCVWLQCAFNASASTGTKIQYQWDCGALPNCSSTAPALTFAYPHEGPRTVVVTVRDSLARVATASKTFTVTAPPDTIVTVPPVDTTTPPPPIILPVDTSTIATPAELPRAVPAPVFAKATRVVTLTGGTITGDLQAALNASTPGDSLILAGTFTGNFVLPTRPCGAGISIVGGSAGAGRVTPAMASAFAKIVTPNSAPALKTTNPTCGWRLSTLEITGTLAQTSIQYGIIWLGDGGWVGGGENQVSLAQVPQQILMDRVYLHGSATLNSTRCLFLNSGNTVIKDSYISDCHASGFDSQAILGCNGPGPYLIDGNYLEGAGESVMFGGCDPAASELIPSDITFRRNHISKPPAWKSVWTIKNCFELKDARRVLIEANVFGAPCTWVAAQVGMAIVIKSSTETCAACTWEGSKDITIRYNRFDGAHRGLNLQAIDESSAGATASHTERVTVEQNLFTGIGTSNGIAPSDGWLMLLTHDLKDIRIARNTFISNAPGYGMAMYAAYAGGTARRVEITDNVFAGQPGSSSDAYALGSDGGYHAAALVALAGSSWRFTGNVVSQVSGQYLSLYPAGNTYLPLFSQVGVRADGSTLYPTKGADIPTLMSKTSGVVIP